ncbi:MAG: hypothetical protein ACYC1Z_11840 [Georgenia sp.]
MSEDTGSTDAGSDEEKVHLSRGRFDEGQATDEFLGTATAKPHGRFDEGERSVGAAKPGPARGRFDEGQATDEDLETETAKPHGRFDEGERTEPLPESDDQQNVF